MREYEEIILKAYNNVWKIERFLKHLNGAKMSSPVSLTYAAYLLSISGLEIIIINIIPVLKNISIYVLLAIPILGTLLLKKIKPDGRNPVNYISKVTEHITGRKKIIERFSQIEIKEEIICFDKKIACRRSVRSG